MSALQKRGFFPSGSNGKYLQTLTNLVMIGTSLLVFLPPAIATFPQRATVAVDRLEAKFQGVEDPKTAEKLDRVEFNKGL